jgi:hypothetical protein
MPPLKHPSLHPPQKAVLATPRKGAQIQIQHQHLLTARYNLGIDLGFDFIPMY